MQSGVLKQPRGKLDIVGLGPFECRHHHHVCAGEAITHQEVSARQRALGDSDLLMKSFYRRRDSGGSLTVQRS